MIVERLELIDYRNYNSALFELTTGTTAVLGRNGQGKTNLAEALAYLATLTSFRAVPPEALIRVGADQAVIRATVRNDDGRELLIEAELHRQGRNRVQVNRQRLARVRDLLGVLRVSVFTPDDLVIIKGGPGERRRFMDDTLVALATKYDALRLEIDRVVKQRNTLLKNSRATNSRSKNGRFNSAGATSGAIGGDELTRGSPAGDVPVGDVPVRDNPGGDDAVGDLVATLDVWDLRLSELGEQFGHARATLIARIQPMVVEAYAQLSGVDTPIEIRYEPSWRRIGLANALVESRAEDLRRGVSTVGPHRDDIEIILNGLPARTHASQGEQRTLALAMRLAAHRLITERTGSAPVLVLDDVLSELDPSRAAALLDAVPDGQVVITSASPLPSMAAVDRTLHIKAGTVVETAYEGEFDGP